MLDTDTSTKYTDEQDTRRHALLGLKCTANHDIARFSFADLETLDALVAEGFLDPEETQNSSPRVKDFMNFMRENKHRPYGVTAHGYIVSNDRGDRRVSLEGIQHNSSEADFIVKFMTFGNGADDFGPRYLWWD